MGRQFFPKTYRYRIVDIRFWTLSRTLSLLNRPSWVNLLERDAQLTLLTRLDRSERVFLDATARIDFVAGNLTRAAAGHCARLADSIRQGNGVRASAISVERSCVGVCAG